MDPVDRLTAALAERYRIERELGAGGMATVYLAFDVRHDRKVALKVLRPELSAILGAERFLHEIKTTANLQHPHILSLFDSGEADGLVFYVMPYVEGESLRDRLMRDKQLPVEDAVRIATEVAGALDYAHRHGVVHRDIKPENILLHDGSALVADFGIALAVSTAGANTRMTETGMSLGTPHYMSPEQAMGQREITARSDVYALGCVLYEMLTGDPPFTGSTAQAIVARVLTETPRALVPQRHTIPAHVEAAVQHALEKLPADRFASAAEFAAALGNRGFTTTTAAALVARQPVRRAGRLVLAAAVLLLLAASGAAGWWLGHGRAPSPVTRYGLALPTSQMPAPEAVFALAPTGDRLVFQGPGQGGATRLWVKQRDRFEATPVIGTENVVTFAISPDGQWLAYVQNGQLKKLPFVGGAPITLADSVSTVSLGLAWLDDGTLVYVQSGGRALRRVPAVGGPSTVVVRADSQVDGVSLLGILPTPLPGARGILFTRCAGGLCGVKQDLWVLDLRNGRTHALVIGAAMGWYLRTGHVLYVRRDGGMFVAPFDLTSLAMRGAPVPVLDSITVLNDVLPLVSLSSEGTLALRPGIGRSSRSLYELVWLDRAGRETPVDTAWPFRLTSFGGNVGWALAPDGKRLAIGVSTDAGDDIWIRQMPGGPTSRLTFDSLPDFRPRWSRDGRSVLYIRQRSTGGDVYRKPADGTGTEELVADLRAGIYEALPAPDGVSLLVRTGGTVNTVGGRDIGIILPGTDSVPRPVVTTPFDEAAMALSPDGRWLAYESNETGRTEVYVRPFPDAQSGKSQASVDGGVAPLWAKNGRELYFVNPKREMVAVSVAAGAAPRFGPRTVLFRLRDGIYLADHENYTPYDVAADGRFLMARRVHMDVAQVAPIIVAENWFTELAQKMGRR